MRETLDPGGRFRRRIKSNSAARYLTGFNMGAMFGGNY
jgi:hypothetical protein